MKKKKISLIISLFVVLTLLVGYIASYAVDKTLGKVTLSAVDANGIGYSNGDPGNGGGFSSQKIWNFKINGAVTTRNIYCVKGGYGETWGSDENNELTYNLSYDFQQDRNKLISSLTTQEGTLVKDLLDNTKYYRELLWLFDNYFLPGDNKTTYLEKMYDAKYSYDARYNPTSSFDWDDNTYVEFNDNLTDADIIAVQRSVIWYFTNYKLDGTDKYNHVDNSTDKNQLRASWLKITENNGQSYNNLNSDRSKLAQLLYNKLISKAEAGANLYTEENNYTIGGPARVNVSGLTENNSKYIIKVNKSENNIIAGPISISDGQYTDATISVVDNSGKTLNYTITDANGNAKNKTIKEMIGQGEFYVTVDNAKIDEVKISISITSQTTKKTLYLKGTETDGKITLDKEQPLVEITREPETETIELIGKVNNFDLALRKYIIKVNGSAITNTRVPSVSTDSLSTGTTATYRHRKDPVVVKTNDTITYSITIFNEGNHDGYAKSIVDQLPDGLMFLNSNNAELVATKKDGSEGNHYKWTVPSYSGDNKITLTQTGTTKDLKAYSNGNLDYETITFDCKVMAKADTKNKSILTNVAWISGYHDSTEGTDTTVDIDSQTTSSPNVNKTGLVSTDETSYKGKSTNKNDLTDRNYHYEGNQDDDDFEKIVIMPEEKIFDLALKKFIAAVSKDQKIETGEYLTDTKDKDGKYERAPIVTAIYNRKQVDGVNIKDTVEYKENSKEPLIVEHNDYVLYTIRVYNQGEVNGYASKIKDTLPKGLEFVVDNTEFNGIWNLEGLDSDGRQVITTTWFAKGQGAELNSKEGDANYKANLLKALQSDSAISEENPDYLDAQVLCKVTEPSSSNRVLVNYAQISDDSDEDGNPIDDIDSTPDVWKDEDDEDIERIKLQCFDLSLRKFITAINGVEDKTSNGKYTREPVVDVTPLINETGTTAIYNHSKKPVAVQVGDKVVYTIRVYNEGDIDGYASEITDYLPPYLTFDKDSEINAKYQWEVSEDGRQVKTKYLASSDNILKAFDGKTTLDYKDVKIECIVSDKAIVKENITNIAEISEYTYNDNKVPQDADSTADNIDKDLPEDKDLPSYKEDEIDKSYVPGNEDDDDFEKVYIKDFDLALRKFITEIDPVGKKENEGTTKVTTRVPVPSIGEDGNIVYNHPKDPLTVHVSDVVIYTIRVYNEGEISGYASEISDDIPEYLEYLPEYSTNKDYKWKMYDKDGNETDDVSQAVRVKTDYLSRENDKNNLLKAFDGNIEHLSYKDVQIAFRVKDPNSNTIIITNHAQISDDTDENGKPIDDKDSEPDKWNEGEDDQDIEHVKVEYFDLALLKFVRRVIVIEDGKETITETGYNGLEDPEPIVKVELHRKKLSNVVVKFVYGITITNEGDIEGYAKEITDYIPEGLKFVAEDNPLWKDEGNNVISTRQLENTLLKPGESATVEVTLTWINGKDNLNVKTNTAEISEDDNPYDVPDRDSTPDNQVPGEDDIDIAKVMLAIATGAPKTYFLLTLGLLVTIGTGVILIKKFVI